VFKRLAVVAASLGVAGAIALTLGEVRAADSPAGALAASCGVPTTPPPAKAGGRGQLPIFPPGQYQVTLPAVSLLGVRNDLPNPYQAGVYGFNPGIRRGIRIGSARDGTVRYLIPDPCPYPYAGVSSLAEGVTVDAKGDVYAADFLMDVRKFVRTTR
jgi:hypothetical protein